MRSVISTNPFTHTGAAFLVGGRACSSLLDGMARCHPVPVAIKQHAGEEARLRSFSAIVVLGSVAGKLRLDRIPQRLIDDRLMFAKIRLLVVNDLAAIDTVLQHQELSPNLGDGLRDQAAAVWDCEDAGLAATSIPSVNLTP